MNTSVAQLIADRANHVSQLASGENLELSTSFFIWKYAGNKQVARETADYIGPAVDLRFNIREHLKDPKERNYRDESAAATW